MPYSFQGNENNASKAFAKEINASWRATNETCYNIVGMRVEEAIAFLKKVELGDQHVHYRRYNKKIPHRTGGQPGRFPKKAAKVVRTLLESAKANAETLNIDSEKMRVAHATAYKARTLQRMRPKGRLRHHNIELTNVEMVLKKTRA